MKANHNHFLSRISNDELFTNLSNNKMKANHNKAVEVKIDFATVYKLIK